MKKKEMQNEIIRLKIQVEWILEHFVNFVRKFQEEGCPHPYPIPVFREDFKNEDRRCIEKFCR